MPLRDQNGRFLPASGGTADAGDNKPTCAKEAGAADPLERHRDELAGLKNAYESLVVLAEKSEKLATELLNIDEAIDVSSTLLLDSFDAELEAEIVNLSGRAAVVKAQANTLSAQQRAAEEGLQRRLPGDIQATNRLCDYWLFHLVDREAAKLLESVVEAEAGSPEVQTAAQVLSRVSKAYTRAKEALGQPASVSFAWMQNLNPPQSERSAWAQSIGRRFNDPLFAPFDRAAVVQSLLAGTKRQLERWSELLEQISHDASFTPPSFIEPPRPEVPVEWAQPLVGSYGPGRNIIAEQLAQAGKTWEELSPAAQEMLTRLQSEQDQLWQPSAEVTFG